MSETCDIIGDKSKMMKENRVECSWKRKFWHSSAYCIIEEKEAGKRNNLIENVNGSRGVFWSEKINKLGNGIIIVTNSMAFL